MLDAGIIALEGMIRRRSDTTRGCGFSCCACSPYHSTYCRLPTSIPSTTFTHCACPVEERLTKQRQEEWTNVSE